MARLDRDEYFMQIAEVTAQRSTCSKLVVGAVAVKNNRIVCTGYNGSPAGMPHCSENGHLEVDDHCIATVHAEMNCICQAAKMGISLEGSVLYVTHIPCFNCLKHLINVGVDEVVYRHDYKKELIPALYSKHINVRQLDRGVKNGSSNNS